MADSRLKLDFVDSLRGIAILLVLTAHNYLGFLNDQNEYPPWFAALIYQGVYGVQLFYIMSAFTLFLSLSFEKESLMTFKNFLARRFFRIAPLFYLAIAYYSMVALYNRGTEYSLAQILSTITFTNGLSVNWINGIFFGSWSIAIEMPFYIIVPILFNYVKTLDKAVWFFIVSVIVARGTIIILKNTSLVLEPGFKEFLYFYLPAQLPVFSLGIILFFLIQSYGNKLTIKPLTLLAISLLLIGHFVLTGVITSFVLLSVGFLGFAYSLFLLKPSFFVNRFTVFIGKISYGVYLFHWAIIDFIKATGASYLFVSSMVNFFLREALLIILCIGIAYPLHHIVEVPFQNLGRTLIKKSLV